MISLSRRQWLIVTGIGMAAFWVALAAIEQTLPEGTPGVVQFEFVGNEEKAARYLSEWGSDGRDAIRLSLWVDFGFMALYGAFLTLAALATRDFAREKGLRALAAAGVVAPFCAAFAAVFDAAENTALLLIVGGDIGSAAPELATAFASIKFVLVILAIAYVGWGLVSRFLHRGERATRR